MANGALWPPGDGEMARLFREHDWAATPLGPIAAWPDRLRTHVELMLASDLVLCLLWGDQATMVYNGAYAAAIGDRHPAALGAPALEVWADIRADIEPLLRRALAGETAMVRDLQLRFSPGLPWEEVWFDLTYTPIPDGQGGVAGVLALLADTTERARAEAALRASEERLRLVFDSMDEGFCLIEVAPDRQGGTPDLIFREVNGAFARQTGLGNPVGKTVRELLPAFESYWVELFERVVRTGEPVREENYVRDLDRWFRVHFAHVGGEGSWLVSVVFDDVSARKRAEAVLRQSEADLQERVAVATAEVRDLSRRLLLAQEEERRRLALELHDEVGQVLTGLALSLGAGTATDAARLADARQLVEGLTAQVRDLSMDLRPAALDRYGLMPSLSWMIDRYRGRSGVAVDLYGEGVNGRFAPEVEIAAYRIVQEALTNAARHGRAASAVVRLFADAVCLTVSVRDDGRGFHPGAIEEGSGLGGMRERAELLGGTLVIDSAPGAGTTVTADLPLNGVRA